MAVYTRKERRNLRNCVRERRKKRTGGGKKSGGSKARIGGLRDKKQRKEKKEENKKRDRGGRVERTFYEAVRRSGEEGDDGESRWEGRKRRG